MAENSSGRYWDPAVMESPLSASEKALRDMFVEEYLFDRDPIKACIRIGYLKSVALKYAQDFMNEPYVLRKIKEAETKPAKDPTSEKERDLLLVKNSMRFVAQHGTGQARVAAAARLSAIHGFDAPTKIQQDVTNRGGVMVVPAIANMDDWEAMAMKAQKQLVEDARN